MEALHPVTGDEKQVDFGRPFPICFSILFHSFSMLVDLMILNHPVLSCCLGNVQLKSGLMFTWANIAVSHRTMFYIQWSVTSRTFPPDIIKPLSLNIGEASGMLKKGAVTFKGYGIWYAGLFMHPLAMHSFRSFSYPPPTLILVQSKRF